MTAILHNHTYDNTYNNPSRSMTSQINDADFPLFPEARIFSHDMYNMANPHNFNLDPSLAPYNLPRASQEHYPDFDFASAQLYNEAAGFANASPSLYNPIGSPELQGPFRSNISTASAPSASSSTLGSPYLNHAQIAPAIPEWPVEGVGLGITPTIAGDYGYNTEYNFTSGMDHDFAFGDLGMNKPIGFVGECASIPESVSAPRASSSSSASSMHSFAQSNTINMATSALERTNSHGSTPRMTQSPRMMSAPAVRRDSRASIFQFNSGSSPLLRSDPVHSFQGVSHSLQSAHRSSSFSVVPGALPEPNAHGLVPFNFPPSPSPFFSQSRGHFVPPLNYSGLFPLSALYCRNHTVQNGR
jgi:hypothetical protein